MPAWPVPPPAVLPASDPIGPPAHAIGSVVVVGAGLAGAQTVAALRAQGFDGRVTLIGAEDRAPYDRLPLSKHLLDRADPAWLTAELGVDVFALADDVRLGTPATGLTVRERDVSVSTATDEIRADAVVIASGARAARPEGWAGAVTLRTVDDADALRARLRPGKRLVVVGAGWIGAEVAGVAADAGIDVTVVEASPAPLAALLGSAVGRLTVPWYAAAGVRLLTGVPAAEVGADGVGLADGSHFPADVVLVAVGARPDTAWIGPALPCDPDGSLRVDAGFAVLGTPGQVRAVGDVARRWSPRHGWVPGGHWDGALRGPAIAVRGLLAAPGAGPGGQGADPAPYVFSTQLGHDLALFGQPGADDDVVLRGDPTGGGWTALWLRAAPVAAPGRTLTAVLAVDRPRDVGAARRLFAGPTLPRLDPATATDPARSLRDAQV